MNSSLEFLNLIKNQSEDRDNRTSFYKEVHSAGCNMIAVIDTETNWHDEVMSLGVAVADASSYELLEKRYYVFEPECYVGGIYSGVMYHGGNKGVLLGRRAAMDDLKKYLNTKGIDKIFAYNAKFDYSHLPELHAFGWYDIMRIAAYKQYNKSIPDSLKCCKTGRLKTNYGVEPIMQMLTGNSGYHEIHNAVFDAVDELKIMELLGHSIEKYECGKIG